MEGELPYWMNSLLTKLRNHPICKGLVTDLDPLVKDLFNSPAWRQEMNFEARVWMNHVRELVFHIEDWVDQKPAMMEMVDQLEMKEEVKKFKAQIKQTHEFYERVVLLAEERSHPLHAEGKMHLQERRLLPVLERKRDLLALEDSISNLEKHLINGEKMLKVVSIFGKEGSGKTSLAKEIYAKLQWKFDCQAFVSVGRRASVRTTLLNILRQVKPGINPRDRKTSQDLHKVLAELWEYLGTKRYFIILDGLWSKRAWEIINCALPDKNCGSRVLTTTCIIDVAEYCSMHSIEDLHEMKPLSEDNSKILFRRSFRVENNQTLDVVHEFSAMYQLNGDGMPLSIIVAAGLLSGISAGLDGLLGQNSTSEGMTRMLDMSYADLCLPLKSCFLYLSVFPEEYTIIKDRLICLWRAEGFIPDNPFWATGEWYFNELIIRGLIQPVFNYDDDEAVGCTVHGVIRDYIRSLSREENFVTVGADLGSGIFPCSSDRVRRLSLDCCNDRDEAHILASSTTHLLSMRSLTVFGDTEERDGRSALTVSDGSPVLPCFKLIRVLDLEDADNLTSHHLIGIEGLILLKYLGLRGTGIDELPGDIGQLEHLEMLDVRQTKMSTLPRSIVGLKRLMRLLLDSVVKVPCNIYEMEGLEEVSTIGPNSISSFFLRERFLPRRLRVLGVSLAGFHGNSDVLHFLKQFMHSVDLLSISLFNLDSRFLTFLWRSPVNLTWRRKLEVTISSPISSDAVCDIIPDWPSSSLTHLHMEVTQLTEKAVYTLSRLPHLVLLKLVSAGKDVPSIFRKRTRPSRCIISMGDFVRLEVLWFTSKAGGMEMQFVGPGAMPRLRRLRVCFSAWETLSRYGDFEFGIQHLHGLTRVHATISCEDAKVSEVKEAEAAIREQARHAGCTTIELRRELEDRMLVGERKSMGFLAKTAKRSGLSIWNKK